MSSLIEVSSTLAKLEDSVSKAVSHFTLEIVQPRVISFEDQVGSIRWVPPHKQCCGGSGFSEDKKETGYKSGSRPRKAWILIQFKETLLSVGVLLIFSIVCRDEFEGVAVAMSYPEPQNKKARTTKYFLCF